MSGEDEVVRIGDRLVGAGQPVFIVAEVSANHGQDLDVARRLVRIAADAGADAVKLQTYSADSMTLDIDRPPFVAAQGTIWAGRKLHDLYAEAATPADWYPVLAADARDAGLLLFSTPFDVAAVDHLEQFDPPAYKIASFELLDLPLIRHAAATGRPLLISTGMATNDEIDAAVKAAREAGSGGVVLLRCNSAYPAAPSEMDLATIADMRTRWAAPVGLSDHTTSHTAAVVAVALGACALEKHFIEHRSDGGPDAAFSLEPDELADTVRAVRDAQAAVGSVRYGPSASEGASLAFRRSLWFVEDLPAGTAVQPHHVRSLRPGGGLPPSAIVDVVGAVLRTGVGRGTPVSPDVLELDQERS